MVIFVGVQKARDWRKRPVAGQNRQGILLFRHCACKPDVYFCRQNDKIREKWRRLIHTRGIIVTRTGERRMKFKIVSMLITLGMLSVMPLIYMGKIDPMKWLNGDALSVDTLEKKVDSLQRTVSHKVDDIRTGGKVTVYKWKDARGVTQFGGRPPANARDVQVVTVNKNRNVIEHTSAPPPARGANRPAPQPTGNPYSVGGMKKMLEDARKVEDVLRQRQQQQDEMIRRL